MTLLNVAIHQRPIDIANAVQDSIEPVPVQSYWIASNNIRANNVWIVLQLWLYDSYLIHYEFSYSLIPRTKLLDAVCPNTRHCDQFSMCAFHIRRKTNHCSIVWNISLKFLKYLLLSSEIFRSYFCKISFTLRKYSIYILGILHSNSWNIPFIYLKYYTQISKIVYIYFCNISLNFLKYFIYNPGIFHSNFVNYSTNFSLKSHWIPWNIIFIFHRNSWNIPFILLEYSNSFNILYSLYSIQILVIFHWISWNIPFILLEYSIQISEIFYTPGIFHSNSCNILYSWNFLFKYFKYSIEPIHYSITILNFTIK